MNEDEFYRKRGMLVSNFAYTESLITSCVVANYFRPDQVEQMIAMSEEIFENKCIPFEAKKIMLKTVLEKYHKGFGKFPFNILGDMQEIRNKFAHGIYQSKAEVVSIEPTEFKIVEHQLRHNAKSYNAEKLFEKYEKLREQLNPYIKKLPGIILTPVKMQDVE